MLLEGVFYFYLGGGGGGGKDERMEETDLGARVDQEEIKEDWEEPCDGQKLLNGG